MKNLKQIISALILCITVMVVSADAFAINEVAVINDCPSSCNVFLMDEGCKDDVNFMDGISEAAPLAPNAVKSFSIPSAFKTLTLVVTCDVYKSRRSFRVEKDEAYSLKSLMSSPIILAEK